MIELPVYVEVEGKKIDGGKQKFLKVPEAFDPDLDVISFDSSAAFVDYLTDCPDLAERNKTYLSIKDTVEKAAFKKAMYEDLATRPEAERIAFFNAQEKLQEAMMSHMKYMEKKLKQILKKNKK
jgi:hypothetical protein